VTGRRAMLVAALLASLAIVAWLVTEPGPRPAPAATLPDGPAESAPLALAPAATPPAQAEATPQPARPPPEWSDVRLVARVSELGPALARDVYDGLAAARDDMDACFRAEADADARRPPAAPASTEEQGPAIVTLLLEGRAGELVIVGAPLQELGGASAALADCCEGVLRGRRMPAKAAVPGTRYRLQHALMF
jgi:hypothetical protein